MRQIISLVLMIGVMSAYAQDANAPSMEFLEFLGEWETQDGQWQDPAELLSIDDSDLQQSEYKTVSEEIDHDR